MMNQQCAKSVSVPGGILHRPAASLLALCRHKGDSKSVVGIFPECSERYAESTEELFRYASSVGAPLSVLYSSQPAAALLEYVSYYVDVSGNVLITLETDGESFVASSYEIFSVTGKGKNVSTGEAVDFS